MHCSFYHILCSEGMVPVQLLNYLWVVISSFLLWATLDFSSGLPS